MDPAIKRLATPIEDHPYDYKDFEGLMPKGQYGGGTVIVWDRGTYEPWNPPKPRPSRKR
jgi:bifunctional non-homologous end joining protein LigD